jgi:hypothetical protein
MAVYIAYAIEDLIEDEAAAPPTIPPELEGTDEGDLAFMRARFPAPKRRRIGIVNLDDAGLLSVVSAEPKDDEELRLAVRHMNERPTLFLKEPPEEDDDRFALRKTPVTRADANFFDALQDNLQRFHGVELESES